MAKRILLLVTVITTVALMSGCQAESTTPAPPANSGASAGGTGKPGANGQVDAGLAPAPAGADTSLKGGMK